MATGSPFATSTFYSPAGLLVRRLSLCFQGFYIVRYSFRSAVDDIFMSALGFGLRTDYLDYGGGHIDIVRVHVERR